MLKIAQFTRYSSLAASTRQRFDQYNPFLSANGCEIVRYPLLDDEYLQRLYSGQPRNRVSLVRQYAKRAHQLMQKDAFDLIWMNYEAFPYLPAPFEKLVFASSKPVVMDFDDATFLNYDLHPNRSIRWGLGGKVAGLLSRAEMAFCGNAYLAEYVARYCPRVEYVPTVLDSTLFSPRGHTPRDGITKIGWIGSPSTWREYIAPMLHMLTSVAAKNDARVLAVGAGPVPDPPPELELREWRESSEVADIRDMDVGIMPLTDTPWARGKCGYKLIQYMACGVPVVASPVGVNIDIVEHGVNGFLASTMDEWRGAITKLASDAALRRRMGAAGRRKIAEHYSLNVWNPRVLKLLQEAAGYENL